MIARAATAHRHVFVGMLCLLVYGVPLLYPPTSAPPGTVPGPEAWLLQRIFPSVPATWVVVRLIALATAALLLSRKAAVFDAGAPSPDATPASDRAQPVAGAVAIGIAVTQLCVSPWAGRFGPMGQFLYLSTLFFPALVLTSPARRWPARWAPDAVLTASVVALWVAMRCMTDVGSARVADVGERWQGWLDILDFVAQRKNLLTDLFDPNVPGVGGVLLFLHGVPWFQLKVLTPTIPLTQLFQFVWLAIGAIGVAALARMGIGARVAPLAAAVFLFAPYTRFFAIFPGPSLAGPLYVTAVALCALVALRRRSESALAALGAAVGIAVTLPTALPVVAFVVAAVAWGLRDAWRDVWRGGVAGLAACATAVVPAFPAVLSSSWWGRHLPWHGSISVLDATLLGQLPLHMGQPADAMVPWRSVDHVVSALLAPFAHPRISTRLWGDTIFDPLGAALIAIGVAVCVRSLRTSVPARVLLVFFVAALSPALFVSPVDVVDIAHAVALPVPAALLAAVGFAAIGRASGTLGTLAVTLAVCLGGTLVFDVVNPRILGASSFGIMHGALSSKDADRAIVLAYAKDFVRPTNMLFIGPISAFGPRPVGYFEYGGGEFPADLTGGGKDLLFWSRGYEQDFDTKTSLCRQWPQATFYEIWDPAHVGRVYAARVSDRAWEPQAPIHRWQSAPCPAARRG